MLHRYWFQFIRLTPPDILNLGCGITDYNLDKATITLHKTVFNIYKSRDIINVEEDINIEILDNYHVRPNMGNPAIRGVWFPLGLL